MIAKLWNCVFVGIRVWLIFRMLGSGSAAAVVFAISEASAVVCTIRGVGWGVLDRSWQGLLCPVLYLAPLLFVPSVEVNQYGAVAVAALCSGQVTVRLFMLDCLSVGSPFYVRLLTRFPYNLVRHPLSFVELLACLAMLITYLTYWNFYVFLVVLACQVLAVCIEEDFLLGIGCGYDEYRRNVRWHWFPLVW